MPAAFVVLCFCVDDSKYMRCVDDMRRADCLGARSHSYSHTLCLNMHMEHAQTFGLSMFHLKSTYHTNDGY